jgi:flagellin
MSIGINSSTVNPSISSSQAGLSQALERIASGHRINSAADDAAGLAISTGFRSEISGLGQSIRNANDGISLAQTAEGAYSSITDSLQRIRELSLQSANGTLNDSDRQAINAEAQLLKEEITRVAESSNFNGIPLLSEKQDLNLQVGSDAGDQISIETPSFTEQLESSGFNDIDLSSAESASAALAAIDDTQESVSSNAGQLGAVINRLESTTDQLQNSRINISSANSRIEDADLAKEVANMTRDEIRLSASIIAQTHQNQRGESVLKLLS